MDPGQLLFQEYPVLGYGALAISIIILWWIYANKRPAFKGRILGILIFYGIKPIGTYRRFAGLMVDITRQVVNKVDLGEFIQLAILNIQKEIELTKIPSERIRLMKIKEKLENYLNARVFPHVPFTHIQVLGTRRDLIKHIWIIIGDEGKRIEQYTIPSEIVSFEWAFLSFIRREMVVGLRYDYPKMLRIKGLGRVKIHLFIPLLDPENLSTDADLEVLKQAVEPLAYISSAIRSALKLTVENKALKKEIKALRERSREQQKDLARLSKELDIARRAANSKALMPMTEEEKALLKTQPIQAKYFELVMSILFGEALGYVFAPTLGLLTEMGVFIGSLVGAFIFFTFFGER